MELRAQTEPAVRPLGACEWLEQVSGADSDSWGVEQIYLYVFGQQILVYGLLCFATPQAVFRYFFAKILLRKL